MEKRTRKIWSRSQTLLFLNCYAARADEFKHTRKKYAYSNVLEDMISQDFDATGITETTLEGKMRTLLHAYKMAKDNTRKTGAAPCIAPYMAQMDEIFGKQPIISHVHTINMGIGEAVPLVQSSHFLPEYLEEEMPTTSFEDESTSPVFRTTGTSRKTSKERYFAEKLKIKRLQREDRKEFFTSVQTMMQEKFVLQEAREAKKLEVEERKIALLEKLI